MTKQPFPIDHDLHIHTNLSSCSTDPQMTAAYVAAFAKAQGYRAVCITNHLWDADVPGASEWYAPQDIEHVKRILPLPEAEGVDILFGCETEYCGGGKLGLAPKHFGEFEMIIIPVNHFHMPGFVRPESCDTVEAASELLLSRLEELIELNLPWRKVGIAHLNVSIFLFGAPYVRALALMPEGRLRRVFGFLARNGAGIELNVTCFESDWLDNRDGSLRFFRIAREEGCKFYLGSDAHMRGSLGLVGERMRSVVDELGLTADDLFTPS